ncbi:helix-turn-helix domain-containing protein [Halorientalis marina]|jgi:phosphatidylglycerophosphatase A|uniref:helix-turn-helix domain-containing protein n=1 Tax=Halorientalis marina TaxID=2931976 RepID=UPI001FF221F9|nr:helix-turn-helix domain-containing protein [Halorientalis marina]
MESVTDDPELSPRDTVILKTRLEYPDASVREIRDRLEDTYDISLSHNRVNEILRGMRDDGLFDQPALPDEGLLEYYRCEIGLDYTHFADHREACYDELLADPHVVSFVEVASGRHWQFTAAFLSDEAAQSWLHDLFEEHGALFAEFDQSKLTAIHKRHVDADVLDDLLATTEAGQAYLDRSDAATDRMVADGGHASAASGASSDDQSDGGDASAE